MNKKIIFIIVLIIVIIAGVYIAINITKKDETTQTASSEITNKSANETNNIIENAVNNELENNTVENNTIENNETNQNNNTQQIEEPQTDEEKAIYMVKKEWGTDSSVNFVLDYINENGEYVISVRDKNTTAAIEWYVVNLTENTCRKM